jgi:hypothetical protein
MELLLKRTYHPKGTNGNLSVKGTLICNTIELPWKENKRGISCIPEGKYEIQYRFSKKFGAHFILNDVFARNYILIHPANNALKELKGCIAPVTSITRPGEGNDSRKAMKKLQLLIENKIQRGEKVVLIIKS